MDTEDWSRFQELVYQAGGVLNDGTKLNETQKADAMSFHTLGLAILALYQQIANLKSHPDSSTGSRILLPTGR